MLNLHSGGELVEYEALRELKTPPATATHVPIEHHRLIDLTRGTLSMFGHEIVAEHHAIDYDGARYFGVMELRSTHTGHRDVVGLRNSWDKSFPIGIAMGASVFVCSNLSFMGTHVIKRKHTAKAKLMLPGLLMEIIEPLALQREAQAKKFDHYKHTQLSDRAAHDFIVQLYRQGIVGSQTMTKIISEWHEPSFDEFKVDRSAWRAFNAATFALTGRVAEKPSATADIHRILDGTCELVS